ncbi:small GTP-binding protein [Histomonas meleagridis]|uniref:small GTP-binding protein n=1 Tax=Histomonas meleagridis TaxID=135588 RepID=UPI0035594759|nr:small GTP-binding protein [Histomonas meleagridis]KAH0797948.1 small GTP-binding protein [Histomonas meleagridis]
MSEVATKVVLVGDSGVGKTAILLRFVNGAYSSTSATVGVDILSKSLNVHGQKINLAIWDTAGQEEYRTLTPMYYRDASIVIIVFAVGNPTPTSQISRSSFNSVSSWYEEISSANRNAVICLCGNMNDLTEREISTEDGCEKAEELSSDLEYFETSAVTGDGINTLFEKLAEKYLQIKQNQPNDGGNESTQGGGGNPVNINTTTSQQKKCC